MASWSGTPADWGPPDFNENQRELTASCDFNFQHLIVIMLYWVGVQLPPLFASCFVNTALLSGEYFMLWTKTVKQPPRGTA